MLNRRGFALTSLALAAMPAFTNTDNPFTALERLHGGRLGVAALDTGSSKRIAYRADERFPMCSTFKLLLVARVLQNVDAGREELTRRIAFDAGLFPDDDFYAPVTRAHLHEGGLSLGALCAAAIEWSDNGAANLLLKTLGGPQAVTAFARSLGDPVTRLDKMETALNVWHPGEVEDTTSPNAMVRDLHAVLFHRPVLSAQSARRLTSWLMQCKTAATRIPAGLPKGWRSGNKTGTWLDNGATNDVAIVWPPGKAPILIAAYYVGSTEKSDARDAVLADVGRIVAARFS